MLHRTCLTDVLDILSRFSFIFCQPNINRTSTRHHLTISLLLGVLQNAVSAPLAEEKAETVVFPR